MPVCSGLMSSKRARSWSSSMRPRRRPAITCSSRSGSELAHLAQQRAGVLVQLAGEARPAVGRLVVEDGGNLVLDDRVLFLDHEDLLACVREVPKALRLQRPHHADLVHGDPEFRAARLVQPQAAQRLDHVQIGLAGADQAEPVVARAAPGQPVQPVGAHPGLGSGMALLEMPRLDLQRRAVARAQVQAARRQLEIGRDGIGHACPCRRGSRRRPPPCRSAPSCRSSSRCTRLMAQAARP